MAKWSASSGRLTRCTMAFVLAGGRGSRLHGADRQARQARRPFRGKSRIIDFALSNALNSGIRRIGVATQYKAHSLIRHLQRGWNFFRAGAQRELRHPARLAARPRRHMVSRHRRRGDTEHRHHRELRAGIHADPGRRPRLQDGLRADAGPARGQKARRDGGLPGGAARGGIGVRRHARGRTRPDRRLPGEAGRPAEETFTKRGIRYSLDPWRPDFRSRQKNIEAFVNDADVAVIVCSLSAAGVGINLQVASNMVLAQISWTDAEQTQAIDRIHRIGQEQPVTAWRVHRRSDHRHEDRGAHRQQGRARGPGAGGTRRGSLVLGRHGARGAGHVVDRCVVGDRVGVKSLFLLS